jgi:hypothetical protein
MVHSVGRKRKNFTDKNKIGTRRRNFSEAILSNIRL